LDSGNAENVHGRAWCQAILPWQAPACGSAGRARLTRAVQRLLEVVTVPLQGEHFLRRPLDQVKDLGFTVER
jgi:hypothetical protein